jgi:hypothetical protein
MDLPPTTRPVPLIEPLFTRAACDGYLVHVIDPHTHHTDTHGPYDGLGATHAYDRIRHALDIDGLTAVRVTVTRRHRPRNTHADVPRTPGDGSAGSEHETAEVHLKVRRTRRRRHTRAHRYRSVTDVQRQPGEVEAPFGLRVVGAPHPEGASAPPPHITDNDQKDRHAATGEQVGLTSLSWAG